MTTQLTPAHKLANSLSWALFLLAVICLGLIGWFIPADRARYLTLFKALAVTMPATTQAIVSIPRLAFPVVAGLAALSALACQLTVREKIFAAIFHMFVILCCCIVFVVYRQAMIQPLVDLIRTVSGPYLAP